MNDQITHHSNGAISITGPKSMNLYRAAVLKAALTLYAKTKMQATRNASPTQMLAIATEYTGKKYKRGQHDLAAADMAMWIETEKIAANIVEAE